MPDKRSQFGRFERRDESRPCAPRGSRPHDSCPLCASQVLRPYRVVRRYRGDRVTRDFAPSGWRDLWCLQAGDVSWPTSREG
jgi:hypothetical protein